VFNLLDPAQQGGEKPSVFQVIPAGKGKYINKKMRNLWPRRKARRAKKVRKGKKGKKE